MTRHLLRDDDLSPAEPTEVLDLALRAAEVTDGSRSVVRDEAGNRLHAQEAPLTWVLERSREEGS